jgi:YggT family protein
MILAIVSALVWVLTILILVRALLSWFPNIIDPRSFIGEFLFGVTEPILAPIRSVMPKGIMIDFSPMIAIFVMQAILRVLASSG